MLQIATVLVLFAVAVGSSACARLTRPDRSYYPMQRVLWAIFGFAYGSGAIGALVNPAAVSPPAVRLAIAALVLAGVLYAVAFMRRRNVTPRFVPLDLTGQPRVVAVDELRRDFDRTVSYLGHGAMPGAWVAEIDRARGEWQGFEDWRVALQADSAARRARRQGESDGRAGRPGED